MANVFVSWAIEGPPLEHLEDSFLAFWSIKFSVRAHRNNIFRERDSRKAEIEKMLEYSSMDIHK